LPRAGFYPADVIAKILTIYWLFNSDVHSKPIIPLHQSDLNVFFLQNNYVNVKNTEENGITYRWIIDET